MSLLIHVKIIVNLLSTIINLKILQNSQDHLVCELQVLNRDNQTQPICKWNLKVTANPEYTSVISFLGGVDELKVAGKVYDQELCASAIDLLLYMVHGSDPMVFDVAHWINCVNCSRPFSSTRLLTCLFQVVNKYTIQVILLSQPRKDATRLRNRNV